MLSAFLETLGYYNDFINFKKLRAEFKIYKETLKSFKNKKLPNSKSTYDLTQIRSIRQLFKDQKLIKDFPELTMLLCIFFTFPVTSVSSERGFSKLKLLKTYLRNKNRPRAIV